MKRKAKKRLKGRILWSISLILACSMILSTAVGYIYFTEVVRKQRIQDEKNRLSQIASQITFLAEDNKRFAESILVDEQLQDLLEEEVEGNAFLLETRYEKVVRRLVFYNNLRPYVENSFLQMADGTCFGSSYKFKDSNYIEEKLQKPELEAYQKDQKQVYSSPYYDKETGSDKRKICYRISMYDKRKFGQLKARLYQELDLEYFLEQVHAYAENTPYVALLGNDQEILYQQDRKNRLKNALEEKEERSGEKVYRTKAGYLLCYPVEETGWELCVLVTNSLLLQKSLFVLKFFMLSFLLTLGVVVFVVSRIVENIVRPLTSLSEQMEAVEYGTHRPIPVIHTGDEIEILYECFQDMMEELYKGEQKRIAYEKQKRDMEYDITLSQINPHYLYNVLNTVVYLSAAGKNQDVVKIVHSLIYTLHETLKIGEGNVETTIEKELELTRCYLDIQKYRYPDLFTVEIICEEKLKACLVPQTMIQPLVENAILHGILPTEEKGTIQVTIKEEEERLVIQVKDEGAGISRQQMERFQRGEEMRQNGTRRHIGVENVRSRIHYLYGASYGMEIQSEEGKGTLVTLNLPVKFAEEKE